MSEERDYTLAGSEAGELIPAPDLDHLPSRPKGPTPKIGLIGAGGISEYHLRAYLAAGLEVAAISNPTLDKARARRDEFYPDADIYEDHRSILDRDDITVVDVACHPEPRVAIMEDAICAGKHVLSQKPFVLNAEAGHRLADLADQHGVRLAVNQNGRWAPHFRWMTRAIQFGLIGTVSSVDFVAHWDHTWTAGTPFEEVHHLLLWDFGVHWFDIATVFMGGRLPSQVYASVRRASYQTMKPPLLASVVADYEDGAQVRISFNAHVRHGPEDRTIIAGDKGTLRSAGPSLNDPKVTLWTEEGMARPILSGSWFEEGFQGTMLELLCAIEEDRHPFHNARENVKSLEIAWAAMQSADEGRVITLP